MDREATIRLIEQKRREMERQGALTSQQPTALEHISDIFPTWKGPDDETKPADWICPECKRAYSPTWMIAGYWNPRPNLLAGQEICNSCLELRQQRLKAQEVCAQRIADWKLDDGKHHEMRLTTYRPQNKSQEEALAAAIALAKHWKNRMTGSLWLWSDVYGVGKTHLTYGLLWQAVHYGYSIAVWDEVSLLGEIRETYSEGNGGAKTEEALLSMASNADLLAWDDMGRGSVKPVSMPWYQAIVYKVLNARFDRDRPIIITSNMGPRQLDARIGGAAYSRLRGLCPVEFRIEGQDFRARE